MTIPEEGSFHQEVQKKLLSIGETLKEGGDPDPQENDPLDKFKESDHQEEVNSVIEHTSYDQNYPQQQQQHMDLDYIEPGFAPHFEVISITSEEKLRL